MSFKQILFFTESTQLFNEVRPQIDSQFALAQVRSLQQMQQRPLELNPSLALVDYDTMAAVKPLRTQVGWSGLGIIALSNQEQTERLALEHGADLFIHFPTRLHLLNFYARNLWYRCRNQEIKIPEVLRFQDFSLSAKDCLVHRENQLIMMSPTQFRLLNAFVRRPNELLTREWLKDHVWPNSTISSRSIDAQISKLKKLLPPLESSLVNVYGKGYVLSDSQNKAA